jgi:S-formylglutathione hydrolase FrmB
MRLAFERPEIYRAVGAMSSALWSRLTSETILPERYERIFKGSFGTPFNTKRFISLSPTAYLDQFKAHQAPTALWLHARDDDGFRTHISTMKLYMTLRDAGIKSELRISDGDHKWPVWRDNLGEMLKFFDTAMQVAKD